MRNSYYLYLFTYTGWCRTQFHIRWRSRPVTVPWQGSLMEQELLLLLENLSSSMLVVGFVLLKFLCCVFRLLFIIMSFFFWPLYCLSFCYLRVLLIPVVSLKLYLSNSVWLERDSSMVSVLSTRMHDNTPSFNTVSFVNQSVR